MSEQATVSLNAASATGPGVAAVFSKAVSSVSLQINVTGSPSNATVLLEGSLDGVNFFAMPKGQSGTGSEAYATISGDQIVGSMGLPVIAARANLITLTGGSSPTVTALVLGN